MQPTKVNCNPLRYTIYRNSATTITESAYACKMQICYHPHNDLRVMRGRIPLRLVENVKKTEPLRTNRTENESLQDASLRSLTVLCAFCAPDRYSSPIFAFSFTTMNYAIFSQNRMRIVAASARVAPPKGLMVTDVSPVISPSAFAHCIAGSA